MQWTRIHRSSWDAREGGLMQPGLFAMVAALIFLCAYASGGIGEIGDAALPVQFGATHAQIAPDQRPFVTKTVHSATMEMLDGTSATMPAASSWLPRLVYAETAALDLIPVVNTTNDYDLALDRVDHIATFQSDGRTYAVVTSRSAASVQILDITDPYNIAPAGSITGDDNLGLIGVSHIATFENGANTYAAFVSDRGNGVQILNITDPYNIAPAGSITDDDGLTLYGVAGIAIFETGGRTYAAAASFWDHGVQMLDVTDPYDIIPADNISHDTTLELYRANHIAIFETGGRTYAAVTSHYDSSIPTPGSNFVVPEGGGEIYGGYVQILDVTDPYDIAPADNIADGDDLELRGANHIAIFETGGRTYAAVTSGDDSGVQILDVTDPHDIAPAGNITDDDGLVLAGVGHITTFETGGRTYAAVLSFWGWWDNSVQFLDITDPYDIALAGSVVNDGHLALARPSYIATFQSDGRTYAAVASLFDDGVQLLDVTDPHDIAPAGSITDDALLLDGAWSVTTFQSDGRTYAVVTSRSAAGIQILDITDPYDIAPAGNITDDGSLALCGASDTDIFEIGGRTYAAVAARSDNGIQLLDITNPYDIVPTDRIIDDGRLVLAEARHIAAFQSDGRTYVAVTSWINDGFQLLDVTDPYDIVPADRITDDDGHPALKSASPVTTFQSDGRTYAAVASDWDKGVQILDVTDPYDIAPAGSIADNDNLALRYASTITTFQSDGRTYAAVASFVDDGVQILDITDPHDIIPADRITDDGNLMLARAVGITTFQSDGRTYAAVASDWDKGVQILDVTDPYSITPAGSITDDDGHLTLASAAGITTFQSDGRTYAAVASSFDDGVQILDITDPHNIIPADHIADYDGRLAPAGVASTTAIHLDCRTYATTTSTSDDDSRSYN